MIRMFLFVSLLPFLIFSKCKKKDWREEIQNVDYKVLHSDLIAKQNTPIEIKGGFPDREEVVIRWLKAKKIDKNIPDDRFVLSENEYKDFFLPHTLGSGTSLDVTPMETYWSLFIERRSDGLKKTLDTLAKTTGKIKKFNWRPEMRSYGPWRAWKLDSIVLQPLGKGEDIVIEELKLVACFQERCKIAVIAP